MPPKMLQDIGERKRLEAAMHAREREFHTLAEHLSDNIARWDTKLRYLYINPVHERTLGKSNAEVIGTALADSRKAVKLAIAQVIATGEPVLFVRQPVEIDEGVELHDVSIFPEFGEDGRVVSVLGVGRHLSSIYRMQETIEARDRELRALAESSPGMMCSIHRRADGSICMPYVSPNIEKLFGLCAQDVAQDAAALLALTHPSDAKRLADSIEESARNMDILSIEYQIVHPLKCVRWMDVHAKPMRHPDGGVIWYGYVYDISELQSSRQRIHHLAFHDSLTELPNRALFNDRLRKVLNEASWRAQSVGVMLLDVDDFKTINDTLGHPVGDALLREAAVRLTRCVRVYDTVARLGGDEFSILLPDIRTPDDLGGLASKILEAFKPPFVLGGTEVFVTASLGISVYPNDSEQADDLLKYADSAMYLAKRTGRNGFRFYSKSLTDSANERLSLESDLRRALVRNELMLYYQAKVGLQNGALQGSEALLRWKHPLRGLVPPVQFIGICEDCGLILEIGEWVLRSACQTACAWNGDGRPVHKVAINLSARQFQSGDLLATVRHALQEAECLPSWIELEITESLLIDERGSVLETLNSLREMGITIAIDDFGTGYSALSYLARFPIDTLKIDRSFTARVSESGQHAELVKAILSIAQCLGQSVVAEGVETTEQAAFLLSHGCHQAQGYLYGTPIAMADFERRWFGGITLVEPVECQQLQCRPPHRPE